MSSLSILNMNTTRLLFLTVALGMALLVSTAPASNWPMWRGPTNDGITDETDLPLKWSTSENVKWKVSLPDRGNSTPVVWGDKLFLTQAIEKEGKRMLLCFDKKTGKQLWDAVVIWKEPETTHGTNPYCSASPATDGERVIVFHASAGVFCYDMNGKEQWKRTDLGPQRHIWGNGTSPVMAGDRVFLNFGPDESDTKLICFEKKTGKTLWQHKEEVAAEGNGGKKGFIGSWSDPILRKVGNRYELIMTYPFRACAFDPMEGKELWTCKGLTPLVYNSPLFADGVAVCMSGFGGSAMAVKAGGNGDVTTTHRAWHLPKVSQRIGSGVVYEGHHYILSDGGIAECRDLKTGEMVYSERLKGPGPTGQNWSSIVRSGDKLYAVNQGGDAFIWKASPKFELLATNSLGEKVIGSMAVSDGLLYIRGYQNLWCIGK
jgi:outer membrane protein assembly factor BamB